MLRRETFFVLVPSPLADMTPSQNVSAPQIAAPAPTGASVNAPVTASQMLDAAKALREALQDQYDRLRSTRANIASATREDNRTSTDIAGLESRLKFLDERLLDTEKQIASADARVALASSVPGATDRGPEPARDNTPNWETVLAIGSLLTFALMFPFVIAYARRIWRKSAKMTITLPPEVAARMQTMEEAIESVAVEVERIGEGQRFMTQALAEQPRFVGAGAAEPVMVRARGSVHAERPL